jgi:hypothetical protein
MYQATERPAAYLRMMEKIPTGGYMTAALAAIAGAAALRLLGKKDAAIFVGQWPPTFILFALAYKLLRPSGEHPAEEMRAAADEAARMTASGR